MKLIEVFQKLRQTNPNAKELLMQILKLDLNQFYANLHAELSIEDLHLIQKCVWGSNLSVPISRITGTKYFWKHEFLISEATLDPRQETGSIIECALLNCKPKSILDLGTGSGCILLSLLSEFPSAIGTGVDLSKAALEIAKENSTRMGIDRANFIYSDWYSCINQKFDLIVSNPPYVKTSCSYEALFDPPMSLWDTHDSYGHIISQEFLNLEGKMVLEVPEYSLERVYELADKAELFTSVYSLNSGIYILILCPAFLKVV